MPNRTPGGYIEQTIVPSAARTTTGASEVSSGYGDSATLRAQLQVTAVAGTGPTLNVLIEDTVDGTNWNTIGTFAQQAAAGREVINVTIPFADRIRVSWSIGGTTPSFTFNVIVVSQSPNV